MLFCKLCLVLIRTIIYNVFKFWLWYVYILLLSQLSNFFLAKIKKNFFIYTRRLLGMVVVMIK